MTQTEEMVVLKRNKNGNPEYSQTLGGTRDFIEYWIGEIQNIIKSNEFDCKLDGISSSEAKKARLYSKLAIPVHQYRLNRKALIEAEYDIRVYDEKLAQATLNLRKMPI